MQKPNQIKNCILFSTADWAERYWTNKQHTTMTLAKMGIRVLYVESLGFRGPKINSGRDWSRLIKRFKSGLYSAIFGPKKVADNVWVYSPLVIPAAHHKPGLKILNSWIVAFTVRRFSLFQKFSNPLIWTYHPYVTDVVKKLNYQTLIYHNVDDISAVPGVNKQAFMDAEIELMKLCSAIFTTTLTLKQRCDPYHTNVIFYPNVVDFEHFSQAQDNNNADKSLEDYPQPRLIYHGVLSDFKLDFDLLYKSAKLTPQWQWFFIGEEREGQQNPVLAKLNKLQNTHFLGFKSYEDLPKYLAGMDVGLLPTKRNEYTKSMFPMKYFEYVAAGLPVVSTPLSFSVNQNAAMEIAENADEFVDAIKRQLDRGRLVSKDAQEFVGENTWETRTVKMLEDIKIAMD